MSQATSTGGGGLMPGLKRGGGGGLFVTRYEGPGALTFAAKVPGHIMPVDIAPGQAYFVHRHGWLCGTAGHHPEHRPAARFPRRGVRPGRLHPAETGRPGPGLDRVVRRADHLRPAARPDAARAPRARRHVPGQRAVPDDPDTGRRQCLLRRGRLPAGGAHRPGPDLAPVDAIGRWPTRSPYLGGETAKAAGGAGRSAASSATCSAGSWLPPPRLRRTRAQARRGAGWRGAAPPRRPSSASLPSAASRGQVLHPAVGGEHQPLGRHVGQRAADPAGDLARGLHRRGRSGPGRPG